MSQTTHWDDDYLPCSEYLGIEVDENGIHRFNEKDKFYFSLIDHGIVALRSEGYATESGRENGVASVLKNLNIKEQYVTRKLPDGRWVLSLKAGNNQEIARSCPEDTEEEALSYLPTERAKFAAEFLRLASIEAGTIPQDNVAFAPDNDDESQKVSDDYMICREYEEKIASISSDHKDFISFQHEKTGKHYFAWIDGNKIIMRSEGYPTTAARDNGIQSVIKNRDIEERFSLETHHGAYFFSFKSRQSSGNSQNLSIFY
ncbi:MAG: YegP family protein [Saprospiraceae bacterium]|nr:YegP family protein [Saprospiraceae bacterium]